MSNSQSASNIRNDIYIINQRCHIWGFYSVWSLSMITVIHSFILLHYEIYFIPKTLFFLNNVINDLFDEQVLFSTYCHSLTFIYHTRIRIIIILRIQITNTTGSTNPCLYEKPKSTAVFPLSSPVKPMSVPLHSHRLPCHSLCALVHIPCVPL